MPRRREGGGPPYLPARGRVVPRARPDADRARPRRDPGAGSVSRPRPGAWIVLFGQPRRLVSAPFIPRAFRVESRAFRSLGMAVAGGIGADRLRSFVERIQRLAEERSEEHTSELQSLMRMSSAVLH